MFEADWEDTSAWAARGGTGFTAENALCCWGLRLLFVVWILLLLASTWGVLLLDKRFFHKAV
jgi:hypothetical protein